MNEFSHLYNNEYFKNRLFNDPRRLKSFSQEKELIKKHVDFNGVICDVGCSTGEFLKAIDWSGPKYGMEINEDAITLARKSGISFDKDIKNTENYFDVVVFRGTIQHLPEPFQYIKDAHKALKPGGLIIFLATPNSNSIVYKLFNKLPALNPKLNFFIPSDITLSNVLKNFDFDVIEIEKPYFRSPYARLIRDHLMFFASLLGIKEPTYPFWGNMMNMIGMKK